MTFVLYNNIAVFKFGLKKKEVTCWSITINPCTIFVRIISCIIRRILLLLLLYIIHIYIYLYIGTIYTSHHLVTIATPIDTYTECIYYVIPDAKCNSTKKLVFFIMIFGYIMFWLYVLISTVNCRIFKIVIPKTSN